MTNRPLSPTMPLDTDAFRRACHGAGHAIVALDLGVPFRTISVAPPDRPCVLAPLTLHPDRYRQPRINAIARRIARIGDLAAVAYAGAIAETISAGEAGAAAPSDDAYAEHCLLDVIGFSADTSELSTMLRHRARSLLATDAARVRVERTAYRLMSAGTLTRAEVISAGPRPPGTARNLARTASETPVDRHATWFR